MLENNEQNLIENETMRTGQIRVQCTSWGYNNRCVVAAKLSRSEHVLIYAIEYET
jgi:hypothetical protein